MNYIQRIIFSFIFIFKISYQQTVIDSKSVLVKAIISHDENYNNKSMLKLDPLTNEKKDEDEYRINNNDQKKIAYYSKRIKKTIGNLDIGKIKNGKEIYYYLNGDKYDGEWKDNKKDGKGKYTFWKGDFYEPMSKSPERSPGDLWRIKNIRNDGDL